MWDETETYDASNWQTWTLDRIDYEQSRQYQKHNRKHSHYFKDVSHLSEIDVYQVCELFNVEDASGAKQHAIKKILCSGQRGHKDEIKDIQEAIDTLQRKLELMAQ